MIIVKKNVPITMEVINGWSFSLRPMMHETKALDITIKMHTSKGAFNVISSAPNPIIIGLSWLILQNPQVDGIQRVFILMYFISNIKLWKAYIQKHHKWRWKLPHGWIMY
jgi:hypothetical protein